MTNEYILYHHETMRRRAKSVRKSSRRHHIIKLWPLGLVVSLIVGFAIVPGINKGEDCATSSTRPCYEKVVKSKTIGLNSQGGKNAFEACMKTRAPNSFGQSLEKTPVCGEEIISYCHQGKSNVIVRKYDGTCKLTPPPSEEPGTPVCPILPDFQKISSVGNAGVFTMLLTKNATLFAGGISYYYNETEGGVNIPKLYKSTDYGKNWTEVFPPYKDAYDKATNYIVNLVEGPDGAVYATGTRLWKSTDGGNTWSVLPMPGISQESSTPFMYTISNTFFAKDGSLLASTGVNSVDTDQGGIYRSTDGGKSWQKVLAYPRWIPALVEASDGSYVFNSTDGDQKSHVYRYANGTLAQVFDPQLYAMTGYEKQMGKDSDGSIYIISKDPDLSVPPTIPYGSTLLVSYRSSDNGLTWTKTASLPNAYQRPVVFAGADGAMYTVTSTTCVGGDRLYKSSDRGATWSNVADGPDTWPNFYITAFGDLSGALGKIFTASGADIHTSP